MIELIKTIIGNFTFAELFGDIWFFLIGYIIYGLIEVAGRDVIGKNTPEQWNWKFWFYDNWRRYLTTILCTYILFRFNKDITGNSLTNLGALQIGLLGDGIAATVKKNFNSLGIDREKIIEKINKK